MAFHLFRHRPRVSDRSEEIDAAVAANDKARSEAEAAWRRSRVIAARVHDVTLRLTAEGQANHFTERWERALRGRE